MGVNPTYMGRVHQIYLSCPKLAEGNPSRGAVRQAQGKRPTSPWECPRAPKSGLRIFGKNSAKKTEGISK